MEYLIRKVEVEDLCVIEKNGWRSWRRKAVAIVSGPNHLHTARLGYLVVVLRLSRFRLEGIMQC